MTDVFYVLPGSISNGVEQMKAGHLLAIAPGTSSISVATQCVACCPVINVLLRGPF